MPIKDNDYNNARTTLANAGSMSASKSHVKHTRGKGSPDGHGKQLIQEAVGNFRATDAGGAGLTYGMTQDHYNAVSKAASKMGLDLDFLLDDPVE